MQKIDKYFKEFKKKFLYQIGMLPMDIEFAFYNSGVFIKITDNEKYRKSFDMDVNIPLPEIIEIIVSWLSKYYPTFTHKENRYVDMTPKEIVEYIAENPSVDADITEIQKKVENKIQYN